jgi:hypothetical protein
MFDTSYTLTDERDGRSRPEPTLRERREAVERWAREVAEWEAELAQHPAWIRQAERRYAEHLDALRRMVGLTDDFGELETLVMAEQSTEARKLDQRYRAAIAADVRYNRAILAQRSAFVPRELSLARQQLAAATHELRLAEERRAAMLADLERDR